MATRALIGFISTDAAGNQVLTSTYNHYDGYPDSLGKGLDKYYSSFEKAREIASMGYISYLDSETGEIEAKDKKPADQTELTDDFIEAMMQVAEQGDSYSADYIYIYDTVNDEWVNVSLMNGIRDAQEKLMEKLSDLEYDFMSGGDEVNEDYNTKWQKFLNENTAMGKIITSHIRPPIPVRDYDWSAVREDYDEGDFIGYGRTEQDAIDDLIEQEEFLK